MYNIFITIFINNYFCKKIKPSGHIPPAEYDSMHMLIIQEIERFTFIMKRKNIFCYFTLTLTMEHNEHYFNYKSNNWIFYDKMKIIFITIEKLQKKKLLLQLFPKALFIDSWTMQIFYFTQVYYTVLTPSESRWGNNP